MQVFNISPASATGSLLPGHLRPGQVVMVEVLEIKGDTALVRIEGQVFTARGEIPPSPGNFWALVQKTTRETLYLKRLPPGEAWPKELAVGNETVSPAALQHQEALAQGTVPLLSFQHKSINGELHLVKECLRAKAGKKEPPLTLVLRLSTPALGETWIYLRWDGTALMLKAFACRENLLPLFEEAAGELEEKLCALGFRLSHFQVAARKISSIGELLLKASSAPYRPVDTLV